MEKPVEQMTMQGIKDWLGLLDRSQFIDDKAAQDLLQICKELVRRAEQLGDVLSDPEAVELHP